MSEKDEKAGQVTMLCPNLACRKPVTAPASARGKIVRCAYCDTPFRVPEARTNTLVPTNRPPSR